MKNRVVLLIQYYNINLSSQEIAPFEGSSYFPLPKELRNPMKGLTNIQNKNNECFRQQLLRYFNPGNQNPVRTRSVDRGSAKQLSFKIVKYPTHKKDYAKIEKQNNICMNVFGYKDKTPYYIFILINKLLKSMLNYYYY